MSNQSFADRPGLVWLSDEGNLVVELSVEHPESQHEKLFFEYKPGEGMYEKILSVIGKLEVGSNYKLTQEHISAIFE